MKNSLPIYPIILSAFSGMNANLATLNMIRERGKEYKHIKHINQNKKRKRSRS